jgi:hypothetical protein
MSFTSLTFLTFYRVRGRVKARSLFGWTPGLRNVMAGQVLPCGCLAGVYELWSGGVIALIDWQAPHCQQHEEHVVLGR